MEEGRDVLRAEDYKLAPMGFIPAVLARLGHEGETVSKIILGNKDAARVVQEFEQKCESGEIVPCSGAEGVIRRIKRAIAMVDGRVIGPEFNADDLQYDAAMNVVRAMINAPWLSDPSFTCKNQSLLKLFWKWCLDNEFVEVSGDFLKMPPWVFSDQGAVGIDMMKVLMKFVGEIPKYVFDRPIKLTPLQFTALVQMGPKKRRQLNDWPYLLNHPELLDEFVVDGEALDEEGFNELVLSVFEARGNGRLPDRDGSAYAVLKRLTPRRVRGVLGVAKRVSVNKAVDDSEINLIIRFCGNEDNLRDFNSLYEIMAGNDADFRLPISLLNTLFPIDGKLDFSKLAMVADQIKPLLTNAEFIAEVGGSLKNLVNCLLEIKDLDNLLPRVVNTLLGEDSDGRRALLAATPVQYSHLTLESFASLMAYGPTSLGKLRLE